MRYSPEITLGQAVQAGLVILGMVVGATLWAASKGGEGEDANRRLDQYAVQNDKHYDELKSAINERLSFIQGQLVGIADIGARLGAAERHASEQDRHLNAIDGRLDDLNKLAVQTQASLMSIERTSAQQLGVAKR